MSNTTINNITLTTPPDGGGFVTHLLKYPNTLSGDIFGALLMLIVFALAFESSAGRFDAVKAYLTAAFMSMGMAIFLRAIGLIGDTIFIGAVLLYLLGLALIGN